MNRTRVIEEIVKAFNQTTKEFQQTVLRESLKRMGDMDLLAFATEIGVDPYFKREVA